VLRAVHWIRTRLTAHGGIARGDPLRQRSEPVGSNRERSPMISLKGHLLVATRQLSDPNFMRAVLLMIEHSEEGAAGVILNRPTEATIADIAEQVLNEKLDWDKPINLGGPVQGPVMAIHELESLADQMILPGVYSTIVSSKIETLLRQKTEPSLIIANYAGWGPGQLESEIEEDSWLSLPATPDHVLHSGDIDLWASVSKEIHAATLASMLKIGAIPKNPSVN
jgi:putative transcriptional regulator